MDTYEKDYNIEDTAKLMTEAANGDSKKRIMLITVAVIAVLVVAVIGFKAIGEKRYDDQIAIAEKSMREGKYAQAEAEYLSAVNMNKRKIKAREGLAYAYSMQGKFDEAAEVYDGLSKDTGDPQYETAHNDAVNHIITSNPKLIVATAWREIALEDVPYSDFFKYFVGATAWGGYEGPYSYDPDVLITDYTLENLFSVAFFGGPATRPADEFVEDDVLYDDSSRPEDVIDGYDIDAFDPKGYFSDEYEDEGYYDYWRADKDRVDTDLRRIFYFTDEQIEASAAACEKEELYYEYDGCYYKSYFSENTGVPSDTYEITGIMTNGVRYCVKYDAGAAMETTDMYEDYDYEHVDRSQEYYSYYEMLEYKIIDGKTYLTMDYNGPEEPEELQMPAPPAGGEDETYASYLQVLRDNEREIKSYSWQMDADSEFPNSGLSESMTGGTDELNYIENPLNECVALYDLNDDGVPELLFMAAENGYLAGLHIYTYKGGKAVECSYTLNTSNDKREDVFQDVAVAGGTRYMIYAGKKQGTFYIAHCMTDMFEDLISNEMVMSADGEIKQSGYVNNYFTFDEEHINEYYVDGKSVSKDNGIAAFKENGDDCEMMLMFSGDMSELSVSKNTHGSTAAMTFSEAVAQLGKQ